jgi:hypothetical protein
MSACLFVMFSLLWEEKFLSDEVNAECDSRDAEAGEGALEAVPSCEGAGVSPCLTVCELETVNAGLLRMMGAYYRAHGSPLALRDASASFLGSKPVGLGRWRSNLGYSSQQLANGAANTHGWLWEVRVVPCWPHCEGTMSVVVLWRCRCPRELAATFTSMAWQRAWAAFANFVPRLSTPFTLANNPHLHLRPTLTSYAALRFRYPYPRLAIAPTDIALRPTATGYPTTRMGIGHPLQSTPRDHSR